MVGNISERIFTHDPNKIKEINLPFPHTKRLHKDARRANETFFPLNVVSFKCFLSSAAHDRQHDDRALNTFKHTDIQQS